MANSSTIFIVSDASRQAACDFGLNLTADQIANLGLKRARYHYPANRPLRPKGGTETTHWACYANCTEDELAYLNAVEEIGLISVHTKDLEGNEVEGYAHYDLVLNAFGLEFVPEPGGIAND